MANFIFVPYNRKPMKPDPKSWVLITGASAGIGEAFARRFACEGWNLVLVARSKDKLESLARELEKEGVKTFVIVSDLSERQAARDVFEKTTKQGFEIEILVNNAGFGNHGAFASNSLDKYLSMIDVMVRSVVELTHLYIQDMLKKRKGAIINVSSLASFQPLPFGSVYSASKAFVTFFSEALWMENRKKGIHIINLCPGVTKTDFGTKAGHGDFHKEPMTETAEAVVNTAFRALKKNYPTVISGWSNQLINFVVRLVPHRILLWALPTIQTVRDRGPNLSQPN